MERPNQNDKEYITDSHLVKYNKNINKYIEYLEFRIQRLTEGLDDMITTLQNMQRNGTDK